MAELVVGAVTRALVGAMLNELILLAKRAYRCKGDCKNLAATLESIEPHVTSVEESSDGGNVTCQAWLNDLQSLLVKARGIVQNCDKDSRCFFLKKFALSLKIQNIDRQIQGKVKLEGNLVTLNIVQMIDYKVSGLCAASSELHHPPSFEMQHIPSHTVAFEENPFKKLKELILSVPSSGIKTIGLKGRGGAGKTLLAKMVNNDEHIQKEYGANSILWITIGQDVSVSSIYQRMGKFLNDGRVFERDIRGRDLEAQRTYLMAAFKEMRALVILDDMWSNIEKNHTMIYWLDICKGDGSTTLITTRDNSILDRARAMERIEVKSLSEEESWKLFSFHAFKPNIPPSHEVKDIAMEICNECKGLPLALEVTGGALWDKKDERDWKHALSRLKRSESWSKSATMEDELFDRLKYSYDVLDDETKKCFLYFAAFPEDYHVPMEQLYSIWQAENLFGSNDVEETMDMGRMNLITLADRSLIDLDDGGKHAKIHDVLRDLAMRIIRDAKVDEWAYECQFEPGKVLKTLPKIKETTKRVSFMGTHIVNFDPQSFIEGHNLEVCLLSSITFDHESGVLVSLPRDFLLGMTRLLYLNLSKFYHLKKLPKSIKELKSLMYLDLSGCASLRKLPESIKELKSLTFLNLSQCRSLKELPENIKEFKSLSYLDLKWCKSLKELPESIKELKSLTHLDLSGCKSLKELLESIKELKSLTHLDLSGCESLKELPESIKELKSLTHLDLSGCKSLMELPESIKELKSLTHLDLSWCESLKELLESIKEWKSLTHLNLSGCTSLKELPESIKELKSLTHLDLSGCESLKELPESIKELKSLTHLDLSGCESLKELQECIEDLKPLTHLDNQLDLNESILSEELNIVEWSTSFSQNLSSGSGAKEYTFPNVTKRSYSSGDRLSDCFITTRDEDASKNESILAEKNQILVSPTSSSHNLSIDEGENLLFINTLQEELMNMDRISEVSCLLHGEAEIVTFCYFDTKEDQFEFYFKDCQVMAMVVGVGLQYAKAILDKGCKIKVEEISKLEWEQTMTLVQSNATSTMFKTLKLELPRSGGVGGDTNFTGRPLLWDLAKFYLLKEIVTMYANDTSGASSSASSEQSNPSNNGYYLGVSELLKRLFFRRENDGRDDNEDGENRERKGEPLHPNDRGTFDENSDTIVAIRLLKGGEILNLAQAKQVIKSGDFDGSTKERLKILDGSIYPNLEFVFRNDNGFKTIRATIGEIGFNLDKEERWIHRDLTVFFGLEGKHEGFGKVVRSSYKQLDLDPELGTRSAKLTHTLAKSKGKGNTFTVEASAKVQGSGFRAKYDKSTSGQNTDSHQFEGGHEMKLKSTIGGLHPKRFVFDSEIGCRYCSLDNREDEERYGFYPSRCAQDVKFQGLWRIDEDHPHVREFYLVEYELTASRDLQELPLDESDGEFKDIKFKQEYRKTLLLNHGMSHLDGQRRDLRELAKQSGRTFLSEESKQEEYTWGDGSPLTALP